MGAEVLSSRAITGAFFRGLEIARAASWTSKAAFHANSDQAFEDFPFLSSAPLLREWIGGRLRHGFDARSIRIENRHWEATVEFLEREMTRDKTGQIYRRITELAGRAAAHPRSLLSALLIDGENALCYDGQYFFDTDHAEGESGVQSNICEFDISTLPGFFFGTVDNPSLEQLSYAIAGAIHQLLILRDDKGEQVHAAAKRFLVMLPTNYLGTARGLGDSNPQFDGRRIESNRLLTLPYEIEWVINPRFPWTDRFVVMRIDAPVKPLILQVETDISFKSLAAGSDFTFDTGLCRFGIDAWHNVAYGYWQFACLVKLI